MLELTMIETKHDMNLPNPWNTFNWSPGNSRTHFLSKHQQTWKNGWTITVFVTTGIVVHVDRPPRTVVRHIPVTRSGHFRLRQQRHASIGSLLPLSVVSSVLNDFVSINHNKWSLSALNFKFWLLLLEEKMSIFKCTFT